MKLNSEPGSVVRKSSIRAVVTAMMGNIWASLERLEKERPYRV
ncbi:MAG: hypothetical protein M5U34_46045 [Chloroflexi bacterium]|nr:hypothetical protein [Chloroflexota bacterium]